MDANPQSKGTWNWQHKTFNIWECQAYFDQKIIRWENDGQEIHIMDTDRFQDIIMPAYFDGSKYDSWQRQANKYEFHKSASAHGSKYVIWSHPHFRQGRPDLLELVKRQPDNNKKRRKKDLRVGDVSTRVNKRTSNSIPPPTISDPSDTLLMHETYPSRFSDDDGISNRGGGGYDTSDGESAPSAGFALASLRPQSVSMSGRTGGSSLTSPGGLIGTSSMAAAPLAEKISDGGLPAPTQRENSALDLLAGAGSIDSKISTITQVQNKVVRGLDVVLSFLHTAKDQDAYKDARTVAVRELGSIVKACSGLLSVSDDGAPMPLRREDTMSMFAREYDDGPDHAVSADSKSGAYNGFVAPPKVLRNHSLEERGPGSSYISGTLPSQSTLQGVRDVFQGSDGDDNGVNSGVGVPTRSGSRSSAVSNTTGNDMPPPTAGARSTRKSATNIKLQSSTEYVVNQTGGVTLGRSLTETMPFDRPLTQSGRLSSWEQVDADKQASRSDLERLDSINRLLS